MVCWCVGVLVCVVMLSDNEESRALSDEALECVGGSAVALRGSDCHDGSIARPLARGSDQGMYCVCVCVEEVGTFSGLPHINHTEMKLRAQTFVPRTLNTQIQYSAHSHSCRYKQVSGLMFLTPRFQGTLGAPGQSVALLGGLTSNQT